MKIIYHPSMLQTYDDTPAGAPGRLESAVGILSKQTGYEFIEPEPATEEQVLRVHTRNHIEEVKSNSRVAKVAFLAAGGAVLAGELAFKGEPVFALIRPPGHHASEESIWGYCYLNNMAISLLHLRATERIDSAFILDFDLHEGDGTINILGGRREFRIHNPEGRGDDAYLKDVERALNNSPDVDIIAASAGFDQYVDDWGSNLSTHSFHELGRLMFNFAKERCGGRRYALLEGGYNFKDLGKNILAFCEGLRGV
jgi:acetoin utilization deacetylase AcuC-like enzyme